MALQRPPEGAGKRGRATRSSLLFPFVLEESEKKFVLWDATDNVTFAKEPLLCESQFPQYTTRCYILVVDVC
jgi:hypothetical protein